MQYLEDIVNNYKQFVNFMYINSKIKLNKFIYNKNDILFLQHLLFTDLDIIDIINIKIKYNCKLVISIHDCYWLTPYCNLNYIEYERF